LYKKYTIIVCIIEYYFSNSPEMTLYPLIVSHCDFYIQCLIHICWSVFTKALFIPNTCRDYLPCTVKLIHSLVRTTHVALMYFANKLFIYTTVLVWCWQLGPITTYIRFILFIKFFVYGLLLVFEKYHLNKTICRWLNSK